MKAEGAKAEADETISPAAAATVVELYTCGTRCARGSGRAYPHIPSAHTVSHEAGKNASPTQHAGASADGHTQHAGARATGSGDRAHRIIAPGSPDSRFNFKCRAQFPFRRRGEGGRVLECLAPKTAPFEK
jgi:hypothetical protein